MRHRDYFWHGVSAGALTLALATPAGAADFTFIGNIEDMIDWADPANWSPNGVPTLTDDATVAAGLDRGAEVHDSREVNSLVLDSGLNVFDTGALTVTAGITANAGYVTNNGTVTADIVTNTYIANHAAFFGDLTVLADGSVVSEGEAAAWTGDVVANAGSIINLGTWNGDVVSNSNAISNESGATWNGDVIANDGYILSLGTWNGDITNSGVVEITGVANGAFTNSGTIAVNGELTGVTDIVNTGGLGMDNGNADSRLSAQSWSGTGHAVVDFDTSTGRADQIVLSGDYSADTEIRFVLIGSGDRALGETRLVTVGGSSTGSFTTIDLPDQGIISYQLERAGENWVIISSLNAAPANVAAALSVVDRALADATQMPPSRRACTSGGGWARGLGGVASGAADVGFSGAQFGYDAACLDLGGATLGIGLNAGLAGGQFSEAGTTLDGDFLQGSAGLSADYVDGAFRALGQVQGGVTTYRVSDSDNLLDAANLTGTHLSVSGLASYDVALGSISLVPQAGLSATTRSVSSSNFGDAGTMQLASSPELAAQLGVTLSADMALASELALKPFASAVLHQQMLAPDVSFVDVAGTAVDLGVAGAGSSLALAFGADLVAAGSLSGGLRADFSLGPDYASSRLSGALSAKF